MRLSSVFVVLLSLLPPSFAVSEPPEKPNDPECTVTSPFSENFFDLRKLRRVPLSDPPQTDWFVKGQDYGANFSINICGPVLADVSADGVPDSTIAAYYEVNGTVHSIGYRYLLDEWRIAD
jgi:cation-dependent mannose-6-phosphate receptor